MIYAFYAVSMCTSLLLFADHESSETLLQIKIGVAEIYIFIAGDYILSWLHIN
jgi:hypothetical protein